MSDNTSWLTSCPASDVNFKCHLAAATKQEIISAIDAIKDKPRNKTKLKILQAALKKKERAV